MIPPSFVSIHLHWIGQQAANRKVPFIELPWRKAKFEGNNTHFLYIRNNTYYPGIKFVLLNVIQGTKAKFKRNNGCFLYFYNSFTLMFVGIAVLVVVVTNTNNIRMIVIILFQEDWREIMVDHWYEYFFRKHSIFYSWVFCFLWQFLTCSLLTCLSSWFLDIYNFWMCFTAILGYVIPSFLDMWYCHSWMCDSIIFTHVVWWFLHRRAHPFWTCSTVILGCVIPSFLDMWYGHSWKCDTIILVRFIFVIIIQTWFTL